MKHYVFPFELVAMSACSTNRAKFGELLILAEFDKIYEDQELEARIFLPCFEISDLDYSLFPASHRRIDRKGRRYIELDLKDSGLSEMAFAIMEALQEHIETLREWAKQDGSLLVHDPELDDYRPLREFDKAVSVIDLRAYLDSNFAAAA
ncbi:hypothetical protein PsAD46_03324 [Pseudovibrio sp. Ad46]|uniref:hypothetical protein n=1 Tax=Pseudovibrio sp. Ad46 TaxID=989432 RepID=UPI0007AE3CF8|nr:hypothetical protein [Pseudovibrio sp. Ad46]KZK85733.1 hypothetical protein PsAD46_03324 [Pseudovibrio sp. Ad46]